VSISVTDHGTGIPPHLMDNLFKPFVKGKTGTAGERSNGLGLYICSQIVKAHGGRIEIATKEGDGATFTVILPCPSTSL
jgi:signal transduction histidine kinase